MPKAAAEPAPRPAYISRQARGGAREYQANITLNGIQHFSTWYNAKRKASEWAAEKVADYEKQSDGTANN